MYIYIIPLSLTFSLPPSLPLSYYKFFLFLMFEYFQLSARRRCFETLRPTIAFKTCCGCLHAPDGQLARYNICSATTSTNRGGDDCLFGNAMSREEMQRV